jgi:hypothetical protein
VLVFTVRISEALMLSLLIWRAGILLEGLLLFRGLSGGMSARYPYFFIYIGCALVDDIADYAHYCLSGWASYANWYWIGELLALIVGCGIILEIFRCVLSPYPGAERFARIAGFTVFAAIAGFALVYPAMMPASAHGGTMFELERDLRTVQAIFLVGLFGVIRYYGIAIGKNMRGIILGYGLFVGVALVGRAVRSYAGVPLPATWNVITQQASYCAALLIWTVALWSYHPNPVPDSSIRLEEDYEAFAARTRATLSAMRIHLVKAARQ